MKPILVALWIAAACAIPVAARAAPDARIAPIVARCAACHGESGDSTSAAVPRLNGQQPAYLVKRLNDFLAVASEDPHAMKAMWPVVSELRNDTFAAMADHYAAQPPTRSRRAGPLASTGARIYAVGVPGQGIASCRSCHGDQGEGGAGPRLAGQHGDYLSAQMQRLRLLTRADDTMFHNLRAIDDRQIEALTAYLAGD